MTWGLRTVLARQPWMERCLQATDGACAVTLARRYRPHVALVEMRLDDAPTPALCRELRQSAPGVALLLMSSRRSVPSRSVELAGASGYVSKRWTADEIVAVVRRAGAGMRPTPRHLEAADASLTRREEDVLLAMAEGATDEEIARELYLSVYTVKQHARGAYRKLNARNRTDAVRRAERLGLLT